MGEFLNALLPETAHILFEGSIYILLGFAVAGLLHEFMPTDLIARYLGKERPGAVVTAAMFGAPIPLCSCGVLPAAAALREKGAARSPTLAFLVSTPETGVDSIALTYGLLGGVMAVVRPVVAVTTAIVAGLIALFLPEEENTTTSATEADCCDETPPVEDDCCAEDTASTEAVPAFGTRIQNALRYGFVTLLDDLAFWLVVGISLTGVLAAALPDDFFSNALGLDRGLLPMLVVMAAGVPLYLCASASTPVAAALVAKGLSPGAALVFLLVGPATNAATISIVGRLLGRRHLAVYMASIIGVSLAAGLLLDAFAADAVRSATRAAMEHHGFGAFGAVKVAAAVAFLLLLLASARRTGFREGRRDLRDQLARFGQWSTSAPGIAGIAIAIALLFGAAQFRDGPAAPVRDARPLVMVSVLPQKYAVDRIAGDRVRSSVMIPPGASPATYEPTVGQLKDLHAAALYVKVGHPHFPFEHAWLDRILRELPELPVVDASAGLERRDGDPHVWVTPAQMARMAEAIATALSEQLPEAREVFAANRDDFQAEIAALDAELRATFAAETSKTFLVFHPAWGYFADAYGLEQRAIEHDHKAPDPHEVAELIAAARADGIRTVFVQPQFDPAAARTLAAEIGATVATLDPLAYDWPENLRRTAAAIANSAPRRSAAHGQPDARSARP